MICTLYGWFTSNRLFGGFIRNDRAQHGVTARQDRGVDAVAEHDRLTPLMAVTAIWRRILLAAVALGVTAHLWRLKSPPGNKFAADFSSRQLSVILLSQSTDFR